MKMEAPFGDAAPSILKKSTGGKTKNGVFKQFQTERAAHWNHSRKAARTLKFSAPFTAVERRFSPPSKMSARAASE